MLLALLLIKTNIGFCDESLSWTDEVGLWNDGVTPDFGTTSDSFTFKVIYTSSENEAPDSGYPKVHILQGGTEIGSYTMTHESGCGPPYCGNGYTDGEQYYYTTTLTSAGNYTYYFEAEDEDEEFSSPINEHTLTVVTGYVWVDGGGSDSTGDGSQGNPYQTIAYGISQALSGQAVRVMAGTYNESLTMADGVHLVSDNSSSGDSETTYNDPYSSYSTGMLTRTGRTEIDGTITFPAGLTTEVTLDGFSIVYGSAWATLDIEGGVPIIRNNIVNNGETADSFGLQIESASAGFTEPYIENNLLHSSGNAVIGISDHTSPIIQDNEIWGSSAYYYPGIGINRYVEGGEITILNNHIFNNDGAGIGSNNLIKVLTMIIQGNTIHDNGLSGGDYPGIGLTCSSFNPPDETLEIIIGGPKPGQGNEIYQNSSAGIFLSGTGMSVIQNNTLYNNGYSGINLRSVGLSDSGKASISDNTIYGQISYAGIVINGPTYADIMHNSIYDNNLAGIAFTDSSPDTSGTVNIEENDIYNNTRAGISVGAPIDGDVTIAGNDIHDNVYGGIGIRNSCNLFINRNEIHDNYRSGIHTGGDCYTADDYFANSNDECTDAYDPYPCCTGPGTGTCNSSEGFLGDTDSAFLDISQNKIYGNGLSDIGGGIDVRHASGAIYNNLVYENAMCGIRYGNYIDDISNNTVVDNGIGWLGFGGGIVYDSLDGYVADIPFGDGPLIPIRNNIVAFHPSVGIRTGDYAGVCPTDRDYNLLFGNNNTPTDKSPLPWFPFYKRPQLGSCASNANEIFADPEFVDRDNDDYRIQVTSLAVDAGDGIYGTDVSMPPGVGTTAIDMGAYGGPYAIDW